MANVIHQIKGNYYLYNHYRVGNKVICDYISKVDSLGIKIKSLHGGGKSKIINTLFKPNKDIKLYNNEKEFIKDNIKGLKEIGINDNIKAAELYIKLNFNNFTVKQINKNDSIDIIQKNIPDNIINGWFRLEDKSYKSKLIIHIIKNNDVRNSGIEIFRNNYNTLHDTNLSFNEFINKDIKLYRGGDISTDVFNSYTSDKHIALKFSKQYKKPINEITIKPKNTLGSYQTTSEGEVLIYNN